MLFGTHSLAGHLAAGRPAARPDEAGPRTLFVTDHDLWPSSPTCSSSCMSPRALKHQFIDRDDVLARMIPLPAPRDRRRREPRRLPRPGLGAAVAAGRRGRRAAGLDRRQGRLAASRFTSSMSGEAFTGGFKRWDAEIHFDPEGPRRTPSVAATIDVASAATGNADRDQPCRPTTGSGRSQLPTRDLRRAPASRPWAAAAIQAAGVLTIRGVAQAADPALHARHHRGHGEDERRQVALNRLAFGVGQGEWRRPTTVAGRRDGERRH